MAEEEPNESKTGPSSVGPPSRRPKLTPEQRRFMETPRIKDEVEAEPARKVAPVTSPPPVVIPPPTETRAAIEEEKPVRVPERKTRKKTAAVINPDVPLTRPPDLRFWLILSGLVVLGLVFFAGTKFPAVARRIYLGRKPPALESAALQKYATFSADELVAQALAAERAGNFQDAADKLIAAKHKDLNYRGILFHVGKLAYEHGDFDGADKMFERSIVFGENLDRANYMRGLLAVRRKDLPAAQRFFAAAATADPFTADYQYYWAEALRMDHRPNESIPRYEQAAFLAPGKQDATLCQFKLRLARLEAGDVKMAAEIEEKKNSGELTVDWLMTEVAFHLRSSHPEEALPLIAKASAADPSLFVTCANDQFFAYAANKDPELATALRSEMKTPPPNE
jgi:tetratricopeptide (TPR) repeat protein